MKAPRLEDALTSTFHLFVLAIVALVLGPVLYVSATHRKWILPSLDAFVMVSILGLIGLHAVPEAFEVLGWVALPLIAAGFLLPTAIERSTDISHKGVHRFALALAIAGLAVHTMLDGFALSAATPGDKGSTELAFAVVLHRLPMGMFIWTVPRALFGRKGAIWLLILIVLATTLGYGLGAQFLETLDKAWLFSFQAIVAGSLLHVVLNESGSKEGMSRRQIRIGEAAGTGLAVLLVIGLERLEGGATHVHEAAAAHGFAERFIALSLESAPALFLGYLLAGVLGSMLPQNAVNWIGRGGSFSQAARGVAFGTPLPICSCGVVPVYHGLIRRGVPVAAAMAFLVATPELGIEAILLSFPLLGAKLTITRVVCAVLVAFAVGYLVGGRIKTALPEAQPEVEDGAKPSLMERTRTALKSGFGDVVDETAPWILAGIIVAAALEPEWLSSWIGDVPDWAQVAAFSTVGIPIYVCASGATPLAAALILGGVSPGAAIAFLLAGPATNITTFGVLSKLHGKRTALAFGVVVVLLATLLGLITNAILPSTAVLMERHHDHSFSPIQMLAGAALAAVFIGSLYRKGPRQWLLTVLQPSGHPGDEHDHDHDHGHDHDNHGHGDDHCGSSDACC